MARDLPRAMNWFQLMVLRSLTIRSSEIRPSKRWLDLKVEGMSLSIITKSTDRFTNAYIVKMAVRQVRKSSAVWLLARKQSRQSLGSMTVGMWLPGPIRMVVTRQMFMFSDSVRQGQRSKSRASILGQQLLSSGGQ